MCSAYRNQSVNYTYTSPADNATFTDHFLVNDSMFNKISCYKSIHDGNNLSFHSPVLLVIDIDIIYCAKNSNLGISVPKWQVAKNVQINNYRQAVDKHIHSIQIPWEAVKCNNIQCTNSAAHCTELQLFHDRIINCCINACEETIPQTGGNERSNTGISGWNEYVREHREASIFWHQIWKDCGSPRNGPVADVMRRTRAKYHRSVKWTQRHQNDIKKKNMAESILANNTRDFWSEVRKASSNHNVPVKVIDDVYGDEEISNYFASKYEDLYSSVSYSHTDMFDVVSTINARI